MCFFFFPPLQRIFWALQRSHTLSAIGLVIFSPLSATFSLTRSLCSANLLMLCLLFFHELNCFSINHLGDVCSERERWNVMRWVHVVKCNSILKKNSYFYVHLTNMRIEEVLLRNGINEHSLTFLKKTLIHQGKMVYHNGIQSQFT